MRIFKKVFAALALLLGASFAYAAAFAAPIVIGMVALGIGAANQTQVGKAAVGTVVSSINFFTDQALAAAATVQNSMVGLSYKIYLSQQKMITPPGWTPPAAGSTKPTPPSTVQPQSQSASPSFRYSYTGTVGCSKPQTVSISNSSSLSSIASAVAAAATAGGCTNPGTSDNTYSVLSVDVETGAMFFSCYSPVGYHCAFNTRATVSVDTAEPTCPSGYTKSSDGSSCSLSSPLEVKKPEGIPCEIVRSGNTFSFDLSNPACAATQQGSGLEINGNRVFSPGVSVVGNPDGSTRITGTSENQDGTVTTHTVDLARDSAGNDYVKSVGAVTAPPGTAPTDGTPAPDPAAAAIAADLAALKKEVSGEGMTIDPAMMPEVPSSFWERKYPNGLKGVWDAKKDALMSTPLFAVLGSFVPNVSGSGSCPSFTLPLNLATWANYSSGDISPPCYIWDIIGSIVLFSAVFASRRIIFGG